MSATLERSASRIQRSINRIQREISCVVMKLIVTDEQGEDVCSLSSNAVHVGGKVGIDTISELIVGLAPQWIEIHDELVSTLREDCYGHMDESNKTSLDTVIAVGTLLFSGLQNLHRAGQDGRVSNLLIDLSPALKGLRYLQDAYAENPTNSELDAIAKIA